VTSGNVRLLPFLSWAPLHLKVLDLNNELLTLPKCRSVIDRGRCVELITNPDSRVEPGRRPDRWWVSMYFVVNVHDARRIALVNETKNVYCNEEFCISSQPAHPVHTCCR